MRYSKVVASLETPRGFHRPSRGKWYDVQDFLELRDIEEQEKLRAPLPPPRSGALRARRDFAYHRLGQPIDD